MIAFAGCKINIGLRITEKRNDGFHNIESIFYPVSKCDILEIGKKRSETDLFEQTGLHIDGEKNSNLVMKAFRLMQQKYNIPEQNMHLHKIIPSGAGLGGGSSDAASMILLLNRYHKLILSFQEMSALAAEIGSDCAFFIYNKPALITDRGENITPSPLSLQGKYCVIVKPDIHISTAEAYSLINPKKPEMPLTDLVGADIRKWKDTVFNDFEIPLFKKYPVLNSIKQTLYNKGALYASMTGSGSAVFGIFEAPVLFASGNLWTWQGTLS